MYTYATIDDLEQRYRALTDSERIKAGALIADATAFLIAEFNRNDIDADPANWDEVFIQAVKGVACSIVKRVLASSSESDLQSESASVGTYSQTFTYANPTGDLYLKDSERRLLGIQLNKQIITTISPLTNNDRAEAENEV